MRPLAFALPLAALLVAPVAAQEHPSAAQLPREAPGTPDPARVQPGTYTVDSDHTQLIFTVTHLGFSNYSGQFTQPTGTLVVDTLHPNNSRVDITFPIDRVLTTTPALDQHLKGADFFDAAHFPTARFVSRTVLAHGTIGFVIGDLTLHGVTRRIRLSARFVGAGPGPMGSHALNIGFHATGTIQRSDFGLGYGVPLVSDRVDLEINAAFQHQ